MRECLCVFITVRGLLDRRGNKNKKGTALGYKLQKTNANKHAPRKLNQKDPIQWEINKTRKQARL